MLEVISGITAIDPKTCKVRWEHDADFGQRCVSAPVISGDTIFASAGSGGGGKESAVIKIVDGKPEAATRRASVLQRHRTRRREHEDRPHRRAGSEHAAVVLGRSAQGIADQTSSPIARVAVADLLDTAAPEPRMLAFMHPVISPRGFLMIVGLVIAIGWLGPLLFNLTKSKGRQLEPSLPPIAAVHDSMPNLHGGSALTKRLDRHWDTIAQVQRSENPSGFADFNPPAADEQIAAAEREVGFDFPAEQRWLLRKHNGQDNSDNATFANGHWLISAERIAEEHLMMKGIYEHLELVAAPDERPAKGKGGNWWPDLLVFAVDGGGGGWYIDARTSLVYIGNPGSGFEFLDVARNVPDAPLTFTAWMKDYGQRLAEKKYWLDPYSPDILWMWHLDHFREP